MPVLRCHKVLAAAAFAIGATFGGYVTVAKAYWVDVPAALCQPDVSGSAWTFHASSDTRQYLSNRSTTGALKVVCPIIDNTDLNLGQGDLAAITVRVIDANNQSSNSQVIARACAWMSTDSTSGSCNGDDKTSTTGMGYDDLLPPLGALGTEAETAYIYITLPKRLTQEASLVSSILFEE